MNALTSLYQDFSSLISNQLNLVASSTRRFALKAVKISIALDAIQSIGVYAKGLNQDLIKALIEETETETDQTNFFDFATQKFSDIIFSVHNDKFLIADGKTKAVAFKVLQQEFERILTDSKYANLEIQDCLSEDCPDVDPSNVHPREERATRAIYKNNNPLRSIFIPQEWTKAQEIFRLSRIGDPREGLIYFSGALDENKALDPYLISHVLSRLSLNFDIRFSLVNLEKACKILKSSLKTKKIKYLIFDTHGNSGRIVFDNYELKRDGVNNFAECFSGYSPDTVIILLGCSTGQGGSGGPFDNIAQELADSTKLSVIAAKDKVSSIRTSILSEEDMTFYHPDLSKSFFSRSNLFQMFQPRFKRCSHKNRLPTDYDVAAQTTISTNLKSRSLLHEKTPNNNQYLRVCKDNPKKKAVVFSGKHDLNEGWHPKSNVKLLSNLGNKFDFEYIGQIESFKRLCKDLERIARTGKVAVAIIQADKLSNNVMILSEANEKDGQINIESDFKGCFAKIETLVLMGGAFGGDFTAQKIADMIQIPVIAQSCAFYPTQVDVLSTEPFMIKHPPHPFVHNLLFTRCWNNDEENLFKKYYPQKIKPREEL